MTKCIVETSLEAFCNTCKEWRLEAPGAHPVDAVTAARLHTEETGHMVTLTGHTRQAGKLNDLRATVAALSTPKLLELYEGQQLTFSTRKMVLDEIQLRVKKLNEGGV